MQGIRHKKNLNMAEKTRCEECNRDFPNEDALKMHNHDKHSINEINSNSRISSKKIIILISVTAIILFLIIGYIMLYNKSVNGNSVNLNNENSNSIDTTNTDVQEIVLGMQNNYYPNTITVKEGVPVEITLDNTIKGCYRSFNIPSLGVSKYSSSATDTIKFTPNKKGTFGFQCSMGMGRGTIIVE